MHAVAGNGVVNGNDDIHRSPGLTMHQVHDATVPLLINNLCATFRLAIILDRFQKGTRALIK